MRPTRPSRLSVLAAAGALAALAGCRSPPAARFVGESAHFRLYVDFDLTVPPELDGENGLVALETAWSDAHTMLHMPDGKITYYWLTAGHIPAACGEDDGGCIWEDSLEIDAATLPNPHELNHAYMYLRKQRKTIPFLAEGIADAIACELRTPMYPAAGVSWRPLVASTGSVESYAEGALFVRYLIRRFGIDEFLRYYEQSPERRDPALFAANFASFWGHSVDEIWAELHDRPDNEITFGDSKICPCSLPAVPTNGPVVNDRARSPYWTLPPLAGQTLALTAGQAYRVSVQDCAGVQLPVRGQGVLARFDDTTAPRYVLPRLESATVGPYLTEDCATVAPYTIDNQFKSGAGLNVAISEPASGTANLYLQLTTAFAWPVRAANFNAICDSCGFDPAVCPAYSASSPQTAQGTFYGKMTIRTHIFEPADAIQNTIDIRP